VGLVHVLAGFYLGSSLAFGPAIVRWADARFAHRFAGGPAPRRVPMHGPERIAHLMREWYRVLGTVATASALLGTALRQPDLMARQAQRLERWLDTLTAR
jgi:hypothetical protein